MESTDGQQLRLVGSFERHAQTALTLLLVALLIWIGASVQDTAVTMAQVRVEMTYIKLELDGTLPKIDKLSDEVRENSDRIEKLEDDLREHNIRSE